MSILSSQEGVIDNSRIIYIFGEVDTTNLKAFTEARYNDMNTSSMAWRTLGIFENLPLPSDGYSVHFLPNGIIFYTGGQMKSTPPDLQWFFHFLVDNMSQYYTLWWAKLRLKSIRELCNFAPVAIPKIIYIL
ncbi:hypothetical protein Glove_51g85 [Diversispora epigaea]|uniref:Uncharacterized protein n=1 Tax=Diversispora epigaea TaxID=1348612 RepID=A0A397JEH2_9GLOM|nr:hypothetical protein Glove_51g85 [Diversispora epigaea]